MSMTYQDFPGPVFQKSVDRFSGFLARSHGQDDRHGWTETSHEGFTKT